MGRTYAVRQQRSRGESAAIGQGMAKREQMFQKLPTGAPEHCLALLATQKVFKPIPPSHPTHPRYQNSSLAQELAQVSAASCRNERTQLTLPMLKIVAIFAAYPIPVEGLQ